MTVDFFPTVIVGAIFIGVLIWFGSIWVESVISNVKSRRREKQRWLSDEIDSGVKGQMENHGDLLAFLAKVRDFKNDGPLMTQFANVVKAVEENKQAITSLSTKNDLAHERLSQSVATVVKRANTHASEVDLLKPEVAALNKQVFNRSIGRATPSSGKTDGGDEDRSSGDPNGSPGLKPQPPKPYKR